jgi:hypothetical protein
MIRELGLVLLVLLVLGLIAASVYLLDYSSRKPIWERLPYWALSALFIVAAACLALISVMYAAYIVLEESDKWKPEF